MRNNTKNKQGDMVRKILLSLGVMAIPILASAKETTDEKSKQPIGFWKFEEIDGTAIHDSSGNENHGLISHEMKNVKRVTGRSGKALELGRGDGKKQTNGTAIIPGLAKKYDFQKGVTFELWINLRKNYKKRKTYELISNTISDRGKGFRLMISWGRLMLSSGEGGAGKTWAAFSNPAKHKIKPEVWYHVAATYDGSVFRVFLDGELVGESASGLRLTKGKDDIYFGSYNNGYAYGFEGIFDEVKIYNRALSQSEILLNAKTDL